jgi:nucleotide-binding universal stress UspA family protein
VECFYRILVATDFSEPSRRALCDATVLAAENGAQLSVVRVLHKDRRYEVLENPPELDLGRIAAEKELQSIVQELGLGLAMDTILVRRGPLPSRWRQ